MPCRWLHLARFRGQIRTGRKYARLFGEKFNRPAGRIENFDQTHAGREAALQILGVPSVASHPEPRKVELLTG